MDERLNKIDEVVGKINNEVGKVNDKIIENERKSIAATLRMDRRLTKLEEEMKKSSILRRKSEELRKQEKMQQILQKNRHEEDPMLVEYFTKDRSVGQGCGTGVWDRGVGQGSVTEVWWGQGYKIQDTRCIFRASEATLSGFSSEKGHEQVLLKSIKHMQYT